MLREEVVELELLVKLVRPQLLPKEEMGVLESLVQFLGQLRFMEEVEVVVPKQMEDLQVVVLVVVGDLG